jgi:hypothetical protein
MWSSRWCQTPLTPSACQTATLSVSGVTGCTRQGGAGAGERKTAPHRPKSFQAYMRWLQFIRMA